jgi:hypothetical protein
MQCTGSVMAGHASVAEKAPPLLLHSIYSTTAAARCTNDDSTASVLVPLIPYYDAWHMSL